MQNTIMIMVDYETVIRSYIISNIVQLIPNHTTTYSEQNHANLGIRIQLAKYIC